tara:strand:- start:1352 stop:1567 length:216 start_codon:yes stop_codon:yes gene_type:complete
MTAKTMSKKIGKRVAVYRDGLHVNCHVEDAKVSYSTLRYLVRPVSGRGEIWVNAESTVEILHNTQGEEHAE